MQLGCSWEVLFLCSTCVKRQQQSCQSGCAAFVAIYWVSLLSNCIIVKRKLQRVAPWNSRQSWARAGWNSHEAFAACPLALWAKISRMSFSCRPIRRCVEHGRGVRSRSRPSEASLCALLSFVDAAPICFISSSFSLSVVSNFTSNHSICKWWCYYICEIMYTVYCTSCRHWYIGD